MAVVTDQRGLPLLSDHLRFVWAHRVLVCALASVGLLAGLAWASAQTTVYAATSSVTLTPVPKYVLPTGVGLVPPEVSIDTDAQLLHSPVVLDRVGEALGIDTDAAMEHLGVTATANSHVLHVTATATDPERAAAAANAAVDGLAQVRRDTLGSLRLDQVRLLRLWTTGQEDLLAQALGVGVVIPAGDELFAQVLALETALDELEEARANPVRAIDPAVPPTRPLRSNAEVPLTSGVMLGALLGCLLAALRVRHARHHRATDHLAGLSLPGLSTSRPTTRPTSLPTTG